MVAISSMREDLKMPPSVGFLLVAILRPADIVVPDFAAGAVSFSRIAAATSKISIKNLLEEDLSTSMCSSGTVSLLLDEAIRLVCDVHGVMADGESRFAKPRLLIELVLVARIVVVQLGDELLIRSHRQTRLFVKQGKNTKLAFDQIDTGLVVG